MERICTDFIKHLALLSEQKPHQAPSELLAYQLTLNSSRQLAAHKIYTAHLLIRSLELQKIYHSFYNSIDCELDINYSYLHRRKSSYNRANQYEDLIQEGNRFYLASIKVNYDFVDLLNTAYVGDCHYGYPRPEPSPHLSPKLCQSYYHRFGDNSRAEHEWRNNEFYQRNQYFFPKITKLFQQLLPTFPEFQLKIPDFIYYLAYLYDIESTTAYPRHINYHNTKSTPRPFF